MQVANTFEDISNHLYTYVVVSLACPVPWTNLFGSLGECQTHLSFLARSQFELGACLENVSESPGDIHEYDYNIIITVIIITVININYINGANVELKITENVQLFQFSHQSTCPPVSLPHL